MGKAPHKNKHLLSNNFEQIYGFLKAKEANRVHKKALLSERGREKNFCSHKFSIIFCFAIKYRYI
jgi:hypothetical protein